MLEQLANKYIQFPDDMKCALSVCMSVSLMSTILMIWNYILLELLSK